MCSVEDDVKSCVLLMMMSSRVFCRGWCQVVCSVEDDVKSCVL